MKRWIPTILILLLVLPPLTTPHKNPTTSSQPETRRVIWGSQNPPTENQKKVLSPEAPYRLQESSINLTLRWYRLFGGAVGISGAGLFSPIINIGSNLLVAGTTDLTLLNQDGSTSWSLDLVDLMWQAGLNPDYVESTHIVADNSSVFVAFREQTRISVMSVSLSDGESSLLEKISAGENYQFEGMFCSVIGEEGDFVGFVFSQRNSSGQGFLLPLLIFKNGSVASLNVSAEKNLGSYTVVAGKSSIVELKRGWILNLSGEINYFDGLGTWHIPVFLWEEGEKLFVLGHDEAIIKIYSIDRAGGSRNVSVVDVAGEINSTEGLSYINPNDVIPSFYPLWRINRTHIAVGVYVTPINTTGGLADFFGVFEVRLPIDGNYSGASLTKYITISDPEVKYRPTGDLQSPFAMFPSISLINNKPASFVVSGDLKRVFVVDWATLEVNTAGLIPQDIFEGDPISMYFYHTTADLNRDGAQEVILSGVFIENRSGDLYPELGVFVYGASGGSLKPLWNPPNTISGGVVHYHGAWFDEDMDFLPDFFETGDTHSDYRLWDTDGDGLGDSYELYFGSSYTLNYTLNVTSGHYWGLESVELSVESPLPEGWWVGLNVGGVVEHVDEAPASIVLPAPEGEFVVGVLWGNSTYSSVLEEEKIINLPEQPVVLEPANNSVFYPETEVVLRVEAPDYVLSWRLSVDGSYVGSGSGGVWSTTISASSGIHRLTLDFSLDSGATYSLESAFLVADADPATLTISNNTYCSGVVEGGFRVSLIPAPARILLDGEEVWRGTIMDTYRIEIGRGKHSLTAIVDGGSGGEYRATYIVLGDVSPPKITVGGAENRSRIGGSLLLRVGVEDESTVHLRAYTNGSLELDEDVENTTVEFLPTYLGEGSYNITIVGVDSVGHSTRVVLLLYWDWTEPRVEIYINGTPAEEVTRSITGTANITIVAWDPSGVYGFVSILNKTLKAGGEDQWRGFLILSIPALSSVPELNITYLFSDSINNTALDTILIQIDSDGDGWSNSQEMAVGTDPANPDTDGDGLIDSEDPEPLVRESREIPYWLILAGAGIITVAGALLVWRRRRVEKVEFI